MSEATNDNAPGELTDAVYTIAELCKLWKVSKNTLLGAVRRGELGVFRVGLRAFRVTRDEAMRYRASIPMQRTG